MNFGKQWLASAATPRVAARALFREARERSTSDDLHLTPSQTYGVLPQDEYMRVTGNRVVLNLVGADSMKHVEPDDFVIHLRSFQGGIEHSTYRGKVSNAYTVLRPTGPHVHPAYYRWVLKSAGFIQELQATTDQLRDGQSIKFGQFASVVLPQPSMAEQRRVADFLDDRCTRIDTIINLREEQVSALGARQIAEVESLLLGRNLGLVAAPSTISWLRGAVVPSTWQPIPIGHFVSMASGEAIDGSQIETVGEFPVYGGNGLRGYTNFFTHEGQRLLIGRQGALCGNVHRVSGKFWATEHAIVATPRAEVHVPWLEHMLRFMDLGQYSTAAAQPGIAASNLSRLRVPTPSQPQQVQIANACDAVRRRDEELTREMRAQVELLRERKRSLVTAAVTGEFDVTTAGGRGVVA